MKLLENSSFESVCGALQAESSSLHLEVRLECYSCKMNKADKKAFKQVCKEFGSPCDLQVLAPPRRTSVNQSSSGSGYVSASSTSGDEQCDNSGQDPSAISTKTLFLLISTLNASFAEYDFSHSRASEFTKEGSLEHVMLTVDLKLASLSGAVYRGIRNRMWRAIDEAVNLAECSAYSYQPDNVYDPYNEVGCLETFCYLFHNRAAKRIMFLSCRAHSEQPNGVVARLSSAELTSLSQQGDAMDANMDIITADLSEIDADSSRISISDQLHDSDAQLENSSINPLSAFRNDNASIRIAEAM